MTVNKTAGRIRLVVSDVDGTIIGSDKSVSPVTIAAAGRLKAASIPLALVSARPPRGMLSVQEALKLSGPMAGFNGGFIAEGNKIIAEHLIPEPAAHRAVDFLRQNNITPWLFTGDQWILQNPEGDYVASERRSVNFDPLVVDDLAPYLDRCGKIVGVSKDFDFLEACEARLNDALQGAAAAHRSQKYYLDVSHPDANKGAALRTIAALYGVKLEEVAALGDMVNDVPMFREAGLSIAMGNAPPAVAAQASVQTGPNTGTGWADAIDRYILGAEGATT